MSSFSGTLYVGVTSDLTRRVYEHKKRIHRGFTSRYNVTRLVYFEHLPDALTAIDREKEIKSWSRTKRRALVETKNPDWEDLAAAWFRPRARLIP